MLIINEESAENLSKNLNNTERAIAEDTFYIVMELSNIISSTFVRRLAKELGVVATFYAPSVELMKAPHILSIDKNFKYSKVIIIQTFLEFKDLKINISVFILTMDEAIENIGQLLSKKTELLFGKL